MIINVSKINFAGGGGSCPPGECTLQRKNFSITTNGDTSITPDSGKDGISAGTISVNVDMAPAYSSGYTAGAAAQKALLSSATITENSTVTSENGFSAVTVNVPSTQPVLSSATFTENGSYSPGAGADGFSAVTVNVSGGGGGENRLAAFFSDSISALTKSDLSGVTQIMDYACNYHHGLKTVDLPVSVTGIANSAFAQCTGLTDVNLAYAGFALNQYSTANNVFNGCSSLSAITGMEYYRGNAYSNMFNGCFALSGDFKNRFTGFTSTSAFGNCTGITSFTCMANVNSLTARNTFAGCTGVEYIDFTHNTEVPSLTYNYVFSAFTQNYEIRVPASLYNAWTGSSQWSSLVSHIVSYPDAYSAATIRYTTDDGVDITPGVDWSGSSWTPYAVGAYTSNEFDASTGGTVNYSWYCNVPNEAFKDKSTLRSIELTGGFFELGLSAFTRCTQLSSLVLPDSIHTINSFALYGCSGLTALTLGLELDYVNMSVFHDLTSLESITFKRPVPPRFYGILFADTPSTGTIYVPAQSVSLYQDWLSAYSVGSISGWTVTAISE